MSQDEIKEWTRRDFILKNWPRVAAETDNPEAISRYMNQLMGSFGGDSDREFFKWASRMVEKKMDGAETMMGMAYARGRGVEKNPKTAFEWYLKGAERGDSSAQYEVGVIYRDGKEVPQDPVKALGWFERAANQDNFPACYEAGLMLWDGIGVKQDRARAEPYLRKAAFQGMAGAKARLGMLSGAEADSYRQEENRKTAARTFKEKMVQAERGDVPAMVYAGRSYLKGENSVGVDWIQAFKWFDKAARGGSAEAANERARMLEVQIEPKPQPEEEPFRRFQQNKSINPKSQ